MDLQNIVYSKKWDELIQNFSPRSVMQRMTFCGAVKLVYQLMFNENWDDNLHNYAARLLEFLRKNYPQEWNSSWQYDAFLGQAYDFTLLYDERYAFYKRAMEKAVQPPPALLSAFIGCRHAPGIPPVSMSEAMTLVKEALKEYYTAEAIATSPSHFSTEEQEYEYWMDVFGSMYRPNLDSSCIDPPFVREEITEDDFVT